MTSERMIFTHGGAMQALEQEIARLQPAGIFVVSDTNTSGLLPLQKYPGYVICTGEEAKTLETAREVWDAMEAAKVTRKWVMVCVGGGLVTDLGGFCAAAYKRGIPHINVPTTLLGAVDAAVGGKTAVNYNGLKNEIGFFAPPRAVIIDNILLATLSSEELRSGLGEMIKHSLIDSPEHWHKIAALEDFNPSGEEFLQLIEQSVAVKQRIVEEDPTETGLRKCLNYGHTVGHAIEEVCLEKSAPVPHGYAVAWGLVVETVLSTLNEGFPTEQLATLCTLVRNIFGPMPVGCKEYDRILELMGHDKKNDTNGLPNFTLLKEVGQPVINRTADRADIITALDIARDRLG